MEVFPCSICDHLDGDVCSIDILGRKVSDILCPQCNTYQKPDIGKWVVRQPDGNYCYYDEITGVILKKDMTAHEVSLYREKEYHIPYNDALKDTLLQIEHSPVRWEDITR